MDTSVLAQDAGEGFAPAAALSRSQLFTLQRAFYEGAGLTAWSQGTVPSQVTTNPVIAGAYARVLLGHLQDLAQSGALALDAPLYVLDLGAGTGRLTYLVYKQLGALRAAGCFKRLQIRWILADLGDANLAAHRSNPRLSPLFAEKILDCAALLPEDLAAPPRLRLLDSGELLTPPRLRNPLIVLANYFFDSIPHDAFRVTAGQLEECRVALGQHVTTLPERLQLQLSYHPLAQPAAPGYYAEPHWNKLLAAYAQALPDTHFLFPIGPLRYLRWLSELSGDRLLLLAADKGYDHIEQIRGYRNLALAQHGAFSLPVNFHAVAELASADGFTVLRGPRRESQLKIMGLVKGPGGEFPQTALAFSEQLVRAHPSDYHRILKRAVMPAMEQPLPYLLSLLRLSQHDPWFVLTYKDSLVQEAAQASPALQDELIADLAKVWDHFFPSHDPRNLCAAIAQILRSAGCAAEAAGYSQLATQAQGQTTAPLSAPPCPPRSPEPAPVFREKPPQRRS